MDEEDALHMNAISILIALDDLFDYYEDSRSLCEEEGDDTTDDSGEED